MRVTRQLEAELLIVNPIDIYADVENNLMSILTTEYETRCYSGCFVLKIIRLLKYSDCIIVSEGERTHGKMLVKFEAECIVFYVGEIVNGCEVSGRDKTGVIIAAGPYCSVFLNSHPVLASVTAGQIIPVKVGAVEYRHGYKTASINALPFMPSSEHPSWLVTGAWDAGSYSVKSALENLAATRRELDALKKSNPKGYQFFTSLLYWWREPQSAPHGVTPVDIDTLVAKGEKSGVVVSADTRIQPDSPQLWVFSKERPTAKITTLTPEATILTIIQHKTNQLQCICDMLKTYNTEALMTSHKNIWAMFVKNKLSTTA